jgi:hypothetical protein
MAYSASTGQRGRQGKTQSEREAGESLAGYITPNLKKWARRTQQNTS